MASLNLSINGPSIRSSYESVLNSTKASAPAHWALFSVQAPLLNAFQNSGAKESILKVDGTGSGELEELVEDLNDGRIQFAFVRVQDPNSGLPKNVLIAWCGGGVPERTKGYFTSHLTAVSKILHGYHVQITARSQEDVETESIMKKVSDASGAKYTAGGSGPASSRGGPPPIAKKPVYTPTSSSAANPLIAARNRRQEHVDEDGWGADAPQITRTQLEKVQSAYKPTKVNLAELTKQHQPEPAPRFASSSKPAGEHGVIGGGYRPVGKVDIAAIRASAKNKEDERPTIVKGAYEPVGKVDIAAIRAKARTEHDDRPVVVKGAYEPVGKVDIAAIRAKAQVPHESDEPAVESPTPKSLADRSAAFSGSQDAERITSLPKPKVASKFAGASSFTGTKAPTPGGLGLGAGAAPIAPLVGNASRTFADKGGKTPAQLWAEKKAREGGGSHPSPAPTSPQASPLSSQKSGGEWKSGYKGKSWAPVPTSSFGHAAMTEQRTGESQSEEPPAELTSSNTGGVSALRDRFKGTQPIGQHVPSASAISHHEQQSRDLHEEEDSAPPPPIPSASRPSGGFQLPGLPSRPPPAEEEEVEESHEREQSPIRLPVAVARAPSPEPEPEPEPAPPPASRPVPVPTYEEEEEEARPAEPEHHAAAAASGLSALVQYSYEKAEDNEIELVEGEYVANIEQVDADWWMGTNSQGETGLFPSNYVELVTDDAEQLQEDVDEGPAIEAGHAAVEEHPWAIAEYDYEAAEDNELSFPEGAHVTGVEFPDDDWWFGHYNGQSGLFPSNYVQLQQ
ncbi:actin-binding protein [Grosmannia clavigera kw1407]|uniref:Actin-binding protein n=1 Tax=Grosmannia clavigera (strain kw1407 / UAMH 11150) TaxID=655863 RepID=F0X9A5_GROCL|nr:actin-binding protein [Grosmannia clavigera kw1407]EFX05428.1 actin-binding protein [Grosmannia clavigera kw1407]